MSQNEQSLVYYSNFKENKINIDRPYEFQIAINSDDDITELIIKFSAGSISEFKYFDGNKWVSTNGTIIEPKNKTYHFIISFFVSGKIEMNVVLKTKEKTYSYSEENYIEETLPIISSNSFASSFSSNTEYEIILHIIPNDYENRLVNVKHIFSNNDSIKRIDYFDYDENKYIQTTLDNLSNGNTKILSTKDIKLKVVFSLCGYYEFSTYINDKKLFISNFTVDNNYIVKPVKNIEIEPVRIPENSKILVNGNFIDFIYQEDTSNEFWSSFYKSYGKDSIPTNVYAEIKFIAPNCSTHWRVITKANEEKIDSGIIELTNNDENSIKWCFPIAKSDNFDFPRKGNFSLYDYASTNKYYEQEIHFYNLNGSDYIELFSGNYIIKNIKETSENRKKELLKILKMASNGVQICDIIKNYCSWHNIINEEMLYIIKHYKDNLVLFAKDKNIVTNDNEIALLTYAIHYSLINSIIKLGITNLKETKEEFQNLIKNI